MLKKSPTAQRKGPLPVILTGKIWIPAPSKKAGLGNKAKYAAGLIFCLTAIFFWLFFSGKPQKLPVEAPASTTQASSTTVVSTPVPDALHPGEKIAALSSTDDARARNRPDGKAFSGLPAESSATAQVKPVIPVAEAVQVVQKTAATPSVPISPPTPLPIVSSMIATPPKDAFASSAQASKDPLKVTAAPASPATSSSELAKPASSTPSDIKPLPLPTPLPVVKSPPAASASAITEISQDQDISDVPSLKKRSGILMGLRPILQADGWKITWVSRKKGVTCQNDTGNSLNIIPGNKRAFFNGKPVYSSAKPIVTKSGQLYVPIELLNKILDGRLSIVGGRSSSGNLKIRLASAEKKTDRVSTASTSPSKGLLKVMAIRRKGHIMISLRQVLEADGWTVSWAEVKKAAICRKGSKEVLVIASGKTRGLWNDRTIRSKRAPILYRHRLLVTLKSLDIVLNDRISLVKLNRRSSEATIRLAGG